MKNLILNITLFAALMMMLASCNGVVGYAIHMARTDTHSVSSSTKTIDRC